MMIINIPESSSGSSCTSSQWMRGKHQHIRIINISSINLACFVKNATLKLYQNKHYIIKSRVHNSKSPLYYQCVWSDDYNWAWLSLCIYNDKGYSV